MFAKALSEVSSSMLNCAYLDFSCENEILLSFEALSTMGAATLEAVAVCPDKDAHKCTRCALHAAEALSTAAAHVRLALQRCTSNFIAGQSPNKKNTQGKHLAMNFRDQKSALRDLSSPLPIFHPIAPLW